MEGEFRKPLNHRPSDQTAAKRSPLDPDAETVTPLSNPGPISMSGFMRRRNGRFASTTA